MLVGKITFQGDEYELHEDEKTGAFEWRSDTAKPKIVRLVNRFFTYFLNDSSIRVADGFPVLVAFNKLRSGLGVRKYGLNQEYLDILFEETKGVVF